MSEGQNKVRKRSKDKEEEEEMDTNLRRNYKTVATTKRIKIRLECMVSGCSRKYQSEKTLKKHIETKHPYSTRKSSSGGFSFETKAKIYKLASSYTKILQRIGKMDKQTVIDAVKTNSDDEMILCAQKLLPQKSKQDTDTQELVRIAVAQHTFAQRMFDDNLFSECDWKRVMADFECFLNLGLPYYDTNFCPTLLIDFLWHSLMQDADFYTEICVSMCGEIVPHCDLVRSDAEDENRHQYFLQVFRHRFGRDVFLPGMSLFDRPNIDKIGQHFDELALTEHNLKATKEREKREDEALEKKAIQATMYRINKENQRQERVLERFFELTDVRVSSWYMYTNYYAPAYKLGLRGSMLTARVSLDMSRYRKGSSC